MDYFDFNVNTPTVSAYTQQRAKVLPEAFEFLFHSFTQENIRKDNTYEGYQVLACDGSNLSIASNPNEPETLRKHNQFGDTSNHLHLNALYDILNRLYVDALVQTALQYHEQRACIQMMERSQLSKVILVADRGYENYNIMAHTIRKGWKFLIRVKDINSNGIASGLNLPNKDTFDTDINLTLTRKQSKANKQKGYKFMPTKQIFDYLPIGYDYTYNISFRIARFQVSDNSYELVITNLDPMLFPVEKLKELYHLRWGIETSFRELKYAIGLTSFYARKTDFVKQEIYARLLLYNYCELITTYVINQMDQKTKTKQVNFTISIYICREYLKQKRTLSSPDVIRLIEKYTLPIRPNRKSIRKVKVQSSVSFIYRVT